MFAVVICVNSSSLQYGYTSLLLAARDGHSGVVSLLLNRGAKITANNVLQTNYQENFITLEFQQISTSLCPLWSSLVLCGNIARSSECSSKDDEITSFFTLQTLDESISSIDLNPLPLQLQVKMVDFLTNPNHSTPQRWAAKRFWCNFLHSSKFLTHKNHQITTFIVLNILELNRYILEYL